MPRALVKWKGRVCLLAGVVNGVAAAAQVSEIPSAQALFARALEVPISSVLEAAEIEMDRRTVGVLGRFQRDGVDVAAIAQQAGGGVAWLGTADQVWFAGMVDLEADTRLALRRLIPRRLATAGLERPVLVLLTRNEQPIAPSPKLGLAGSRATGVRKETHLFLVEVGSRLRVLLDLETRHRSEDGFGGHDVGGLALRQHDGHTYLEAVRQDHLPASRARCLEPEPYPIRFELVGQRFTELDPGRSPQPCGGPGETGVEAVE